MRLPPSLLALLLALSVLGAADHSETSTVTRAPIYLPYYDNQAWSLVRGSILASVRHAIQLLLLAWLAFADFGSAESCLEPDDLYNLLPGADTARL